MSKFNELVLDHSTKPVPPGEGVGGFRLALIIIGVSIALPAFVSGAQLGQEVGIKTAVIAFVVGGLILTVIGCFTAIVASRSRLTTYMLVQFSFGRKGAHVVNFVLAATMFGWFGVNASLFGDAVSAAFQSMKFTSSDNTSLYIVIGSILMTATTIFGFKAIDKLSLIAVPVLIVILVAILSQSVQQTNIEEIMLAGERNMSLGLTISAIAGSNMVMVATMPDIARYLTKRSQAIWAMFVAYVIGEPIILLSSAVPSLVTGDPDLMSIIFALGLGAWALVVMVFATWTSNAANLYGSGLSLAAIFKGVRRWKLTALSGVFGTMLALGGIVDVFIPFLLVLGATIPPIAGIYVTHFYAFGNETYDTESLNSDPPVRYNASFAWGLGIGIGILGSTGHFSLTTVPAIDAILVSAASYWLLGFLAQTAENLH